VRAIVQEAGRDLDKFVAAIYLTLAIDEDAVAPNSGSTRFWRIIMGSRLP